MYKIFYSSIIIKILASTLIYAASPYAVLSVGTQPNASDVGAYGYDTIGNRSSNLTTDQRIKYDLIGKAASITQNGFTRSIQHGPAGRRYLSADNDDSKTFFFNNMDYKIDADGVTTSIRISAKGYSPVAQVDIKSSGTEYTYFVQDHLGSPVVSVDDLGDFNRRKRYDAWGQMTEVTGVNHTPTADDEKNRGYTGHEMMAKFNMGQWNGRIFDYEIGAFPQADKFIQGRSIAALNRYALGQNRNPNAVDLSGWVFRSPVGDNNLLQFLNERFGAPQALIYAERVEHGIRLSDPTNAQTITVSIPGQMIDLNRAGFMSAVSADVNPGLIGAQIQHAGSFIANANESHVQSEALRFSAHRRQMRAPRPLSGMQRQTQLWMIDSGIRTRREEASFQMFFSAIRWGASGRDPLMFPDANIGELNILVDPRIGERLPDFIMNNLNRAYRMMPPSRFSEEAGLLINSRNLQAPEEGRRGNSGLAIHENRPETISGHHFRTRRLTRRMSIP